MNNPGHRAKIMHETIASINPATGELIRTFVPHADSEVQRCLVLAWETFQKNRGTPFTERAVRMLRAADLLENDKRHLAEIMVLEMGKPIRSAVQEIEKCAWVCRFYAEHAERFLAEEPIASNARRSTVRLQPLGPVLAVMPWNFPFWQVFRFAAPALMAGNVGLLKHASNVPQCALAIEDLFRRAGFPEGCFRTLLVGSRRVGQVIEDYRVMAVTLTGSLGAGSQVAAAAGKQIKKTVLELGGNDPFIVMPSANLPKAAATAVQARCINNGQSCIAAKRFIIHRAVADEFEREFVARMAALKVGDPMLEETDLGPLATEEGRADLERQVSESAARGARVLLGGQRIERPGWFFAPTVLADLPADSPAYREELFGPVAALFRVGSIDEAIRLANDTAFGLGASAWTTDPSEAARFAEEIQAGMVFINSMVTSDPRLPFGGIKQSGYGRELGALGIREFMNIKTVAEFD